ncbi:hypothetical protein DDE82_005513 [Stemphylium lycopersici]|nr:hypothetical protein DDE82_005513 [Stemphylium lycopersici]
MSSLLDVDFGGGPGPALLDRGTIASTCYDGGECTASGAGKWEPTPISPATSTGTTWNSPAGENSESADAAISSSTTSHAGDLGDNVLTSVKNALTTTIAMAPTMGVMSFPSTTVINPDPTLATVGTIEAANNNGSGLSAGAIVGISIGTLIVGAALAFVAAFFLFKRRNKQRNVNVGGTGYTTYGDSAPELDMMQKSVGSLGGRHSPYVQVSQTPMPAHRPPPPAMPAPMPVQNMAPIDSAAFLPPPAKDREVCVRVSALFERIHEHIESYYRDVHASITQSMEIEIASFGAEGMSMTEILQECSSSTTALKHALVSYVMNITAPKNSGDDVDTLFPEEISSTRVEGRVNGGSDPSIPSAESLFRRVSVYLYTTISGTSDSRQSRLTQSNSREAAEHFSLTFFPWANPQSSDQEKDEDLARIITEALGVRIWLFGQPDIYEFQWEGAGRRGVIVSPGLVRLRGSIHSKTAGISADGTKAAVRIAGAGASASVMAGPFPTSELARN